MSRDVGDLGTGSAKATDPPGDRRRATLADAVADGLFRMDTDDRLVAVNDAFLDEVGRSREELLGEPLDTAFPAADADRLSAARRDLTDSETTTLSASLAAADGERPCEVRLRVFEDGAAGSVRPTDAPDGEGDALDHTEARLHEETEKFRSLVEAVEEYAIFTLDSDGHVTSWNPGAADIKGYDADEVLGEHFSLFYTEADREANVPETNLATAAADGTVEDEGWRVREDGSRFWANVTLTPIRDDDGELAGYAKVTRDMTDRKEREVTLERERDLVEGILETNPAGIVLVDEDNAILRANERAAEMAGRTVDELTDLDSAEIELHDEDGDPVPPDEHPSMRALEADETVVGGEYQFRRPDGEWRWLSINAAPMPDDTGSGVVLSVQDITALKRQQADLQRERDLVETIIEVSPDTIGVFDADDGSLLRANGRAKEFLGVREDADYEYVGGGVPLYDEDGDPVPPAERPFARASRTGEPVYDWQGRMENADGERRWFSINATPVHEDGDVERVVVIGDDVTRLKEQARTLARERDELETELEDVLGRVSDAFFALDPEFRFTYVNERAEHLIDCREEAVLGESIWEEYPETVGTTFQEKYEHAMEAQQPVSFEEYFPPLSTWFEVNAYPSETGLSVYFRDVTERKEREQRLETYETIVKTIEDGVYVLDEEFCFEMVNDAYVEMTGYDREELLGAHPSVVVDEEVSAESAERLEEITAGEADSSLLEADIHRADGSRLRAESKFTAIPSGDAERPRKVGVVRDVTERKERERALEESERRYRTLAENFPDGAVGVYDHDLRYTLAEGSVLGETLPAADRLEGDRMPEIFPADTVADLEPLFRTAIEEGGTDTTITEFGGRHWRVWAAPLHDADGEIVAGLSFAQDVTERKRRERELEEYETIVETVGDGIFTVDGDGVFTHVNDAYASMLGYDREELVGQSATSFTPANVNEKGWQLRQQLLDGEKDVAAQEVELETADGETIPVDVRFKLLPSEDGEQPGTVAVVRDVTERVERERELERTLDLLERTETIADVGGWEIDTDTSDVFWSNQIFELLEVSGDEEPPLEEALEMYHEADQPVVEAAVEDALTTGDPFDVEVRIRTEAGEIRWLRLQGEPETADGEVVSLRGAAQDITEQVEREQELERYETIVETVNDGIYVVDSDGRYTMVNDEYAAMVGREPDDLLDEHVTEVVDEEVARRARQLEAGLVSGDHEGASLEAELETGDGESVVAEATFALLPSGDGHERIGVVRDITERKERERALEESERRYRTLAENFPDGAVALLDGDLRFTAVGGQLFDQADTPSDDPIGDRIAERYPPDLVEEVEPHFRTALDGETSSFEVELDGWHLHAYTLPVRNADDEVYAVMLVVQNVTELRERERELSTRVSQQEAVTDLGQQALEERDLDALFDEVTDCVADVLDADYCKVLELDDGGEQFSFRSGVGWRDDHAGTVPATRKALAGYALRSNEPQVVDNWNDEGRFRRSDLLAAHDVTSGISALLGTPEDPWGVIGVHDTDEREFSEHDVNFVQSVATILATAIQRAGRERDLELYETIVENIWDGVYALDPDGDFELVNEAFASMLGYDREELLDEPAATVHSEEIDATARQLTDEVLAGDGEAATMETELRTADGGTVPVETRFGPYPYDEERYGRTGVSRDVTERLERERALERQREELAALNRLNQVVGEITHAAVESSSREEIERLVCERLADSESYLFAWIGQADRTDGTVALRAEAGVEGYLDGRTVALDPEDGTDGPTARAIRTGELQVVQDTMTDAIYEPWRDVATEHEFRSSAAIPITYEDVPYGVLNVYSERPGAFDGYERTLLARLGNVVGHTINALERKEALMSDQVQQLEFEMQDVASLADESVPTEGTITFERTVSVGDDTYLQYGTADEAAVALLEKLVASVAHWEAVTVLDERFGEVSFELQLSGPPAISTVATYGGRVESATIEDGDYHMQVELPSSADVRAVVEALKTEYSNIQLVAQRRTARDDWSTRRIEDVLEEQLTDRQRATLEATYYAGYFDTPRRRSGEEVAESLGITAPTLHQHLRKGQRKLLATVFDGPDK